MEGDSSKNSSDQVQNKKKQHKISLIKGSTLALFNIRRKKRSRGGDVLIGLMPRLKLKEIALIFFVWDGRISFLIYHQDQSLSILSLD